MGIPKKLRIVSYLLNKFKQWWKKHICDEVPEHLADMFDDYKEE